MTSLDDRFVIDAHQHIWDKRRAAYPWLTDEIAAVNRAFDFDELRPQLQASGVDATVLVQSSDNFDDTTLMLECADAEPRVVGVVAWAPLDDAARAQRVLARYATDPRVVGIRALIHDMPDPRWLMRPEVQDGLGLLSDAGLAFDVVAVRAEHLECAIAVGESHPDLTLVIDHLGHPPLPEGDARWHALIAEIAENPRAAAKISGLYPDAGGSAEERATVIRPVLDHVIDAFGADRLMVGGDWPISVLHGGYGITWASLEAALGDLDEPQLDAVLHGTAERVYALDAHRLDAARALGR